MGLWSATKTRSRTVPELLDGAEWEALTRRLGLSARECDVLRCIFTDERTAAIAGELGLAEGTVHTYKERVFRKVGVRSCAQLIARAFTEYLELASVIDTAEVSRSRCTQASEAARPKRKDTERLLVPPAVCASRGALRHG